MEDLASDLANFLEQGDQIILMVDANSNLKNSDFQRVMEGLSFKEAIMDRHGKDGPSTFRRNQTATPIDGIWVTPGLQISAGGYFPYDTPISNMEHRCIWIDILFTQAFGHNMPAIIRPKARRLQPKDPRIVKNFVTVYRKMILENGVLDRVKNWRTSSDIHFLSTSKRSMKNWTNFTF